MAIFKCLCLLGLVLLNSVYARKPETQDSSYQMLGRKFQKHILKQHMNVNGVPSRPGSPLKGSATAKDRIEESASKIWKENAPQIYPQAEIDRENQLLYNGNYKDGDMMSNWAVEAYPSSNSYDINPGWNKANRIKLDIPIKSGKPVIPGKSGTPRTPSTLRAPSTPGTLSIPRKPSTPGTPGIPAKPNTLKTPSTPGTPGTPAKPSTSRTPSIPGTQGTPGTPDTPGTPATPGIPITRNRDLATVASTFLPSFEEFQQLAIDGTTFKVTDTCNAVVSKTDTLYQLSPNPTDCINLAILLEKVLPNGKANFVSTTFMTLENIIIRSLSLDTSTKGVEIVAAYKGTATLIKDILTLSNIRAGLSFVWTRPQKFTFDIAATFSVGDVPVKVRLIRNEQGYTFTAEATGNISATYIKQMFNREDSFLPANSLQTDLTKAGFDSFMVINPRLRAAFLDGYGFLFGGSVKILDWEPFDVNVLFNQASDSPTTVTIAVYTAKFSISKMLKDLFRMDITSVPVFGSIEVKNFAFFMSTGDVAEPLEVLDIGSEEAPYSKGLKASFDVPIGGKSVSTSISITPTQLHITISQDSELDLGDAVNEFLPGNDFTVTLNGQTRLKNWPSFIPDPLSIALVTLDMEAANPNGSWALTKMNMKLKMTSEVSLFDNKIRINNLELDLNYEKGGEPSLSGVVSGQVALGATTDVSPRVDVTIPFPFANQEITFTFSDFNVENVVKALAGADFTFPTDFPDLFKNIQLDKIALAFNEAGEVDTVSVDASIPGVWTIFGNFSIGNVAIHFQYGKSGGTEKIWQLVVSGEIVIASCTITVAAEFGTQRVSVNVKGTDCSASVADLLKKVEMNPSILPPMISGFTIFNPQLNFVWERTGEQAGSKSIAFAATTSLFSQSEVELAFIRNGGKSALIAGFAVQVDQIPEISFLSSLGLSDIAVVYVSEKIPIAPYEFTNAVFNSYIQLEPEFKGLTVYAKFVPKPTDMLGHILREAVAGDPAMAASAGQEVAIIVKISFPQIIFELEINLGTGLQIGAIKGWKFTKMKLIISKALIGLSLSCSIDLGNGGQPSVFTGQVQFTFTGTVTISLLWEGSWKNPFGISKRLEIRRLGLALGINLASLLPSFGITGAITVDIPSASKIDVSLTLCIDPATPQKTVFELHFTRLLLEDVINLFAGRAVSLPRKLAEVGFPDEVKIYFSVQGNPDCFGKRYDPGVEIHGTLQIPFLSIRARIDLSIQFTPFSLDANLQLDPIIYLGGLIKVVDADDDRKGAHLKMHITENLSELLIDGSCRIEIFGAMISVKLQINQEKFFFEGRLNLWNLFQVYILVDISMTKTSPSVHVIGEMQNDLFAKIKQKASQAIQNGAREINRKIEGAQRKVSDASREVDKLLGTINYHKRKIEEAKRECSRAPWYKKYICIGTGFRIVYHGGVIAALYVAYGVAKGVLAAANLFLRGVSAIIKVGAHILQQLVNAALSIIDIQYVRFEVEMNGVTKRFEFDARIVILGWTFTPHFAIDFSSAQSANNGINSAGNSISDETMKQVKK
ncbi:uncharacterized protein LOC114527617 [Dendronephthya gigantea]|uniref:uncharacterized protein LOC114527617 n=1 Tax=Dendronephthya gigantea TaxID=151771 RepID=UPI00106B6241|nr:uncharacterized protein LOC114527617 [Dendronephthya gigantea]